MSTSKIVKQVGLGKVVILMIAALVVGVIATRMMLGPGSSASGASATAGEDSEQLYTCGMHPNVIQRGPGICPICNMNLTPLRADDGDAGGSGASKERKVLYWRAPVCVGGGALFLPKNANAALLRLLERAGKEPDCWCIQC